jgi:hypothetical protein
VTPPLPPATAAASTSARWGTWRARARLVLTVVGLLAVVAGAFLPWIVVTIHRSSATLAPSGPPTTETFTYSSVWALPVAGAFPVLVWLPLPLIAQTLLAQRAGTPRMGCAGLLLCLAGAVGIVLFVALAGFSVAPFMWRAAPGTSTRETLLLGGWCCLVGYGVLLVAALLPGVGRGPAGAGLADRL